jgi:signal transduction histidine kinase
VGKIAAQITHEIRNPLASIGLYAELLGDELPDELKEARRLVTSIAARSIG